MLYQDLGPYSDWVAGAKAAHALFPSLPPGTTAQRIVRQVLDFSIGDEKPQALTIDAQWQTPRVIGEEISWSVGYGPRTRAWLLRPRHAPGRRLPAIVALHDHGGFKYYGKEKIADGPGGPAPFLQAFRRVFYGGRAYANALAEQGFVVLVPDVFLWGSRRFPLSAMPLWIRAKALQHHRKTFPVTRAAIRRYNQAAAEHEHVVEKYCTLLGTTLAAMVSYEDRVAVNYLCSRDDVAAQRIGCVGLSGGGCRAALLQATCNHIHATVIVGMMSRYQPMVDTHVKYHTWMFWPPGLSRVGDWPDLAACRAPSPLMVQYASRDELFSLSGMRAAHQVLRQHYRSAAAAQNYVGRFFPVPHCFDLRMQALAFAWLRSHLG